MTRSWSDLDTSTSISRWRFRLLVFFVKMCRACEWPRLILPVAVRRTRFAAPLCVLSFGMNCFPSLLIRRRRFGFWPTTTALMSLRPEDDEHLVTFHPWPCFNFTNVREILFEFFEDSRTQFTVSHLAPAEPDRGSHFVAIL